VGQELGRGSFSVVRQVTNKQTGEKFAMKSISKRLISKQGWVNLNREVEIMLHLNHLNILKMYDFIDTHSHVHIILEYMSGGELFEQITQRGSYGETDTSKITKQILSGILYLHETGVCHRDLKPENVLCDSNSDRVVVADFRLAKIFSRGELLKTHVGTPTYAAPEIVRGDLTYDKAVDMWSIGVIIYVLLAGFFPFYDDDQAVMKQKIIVADYSFPEDHWSNISEDAKNFIRQLLVLDPAKRLTAKEALQHPWIEGKKISNKFNLRSSLDNYQSSTKRRTIQSGYTQVTEQEIQN